MNLKTEIVKIPNTIILKTSIEINRDRWLELRQEGYIDSQILRMFETALRKSINIIQLDKETAGLINAGVGFSMSDMELV